MNNSTNKNVKNFAGLSREQCLMLTYQMLLPDNEKAETTKKAIDILRQAALQKTRRNA